MGYLVYNKDTTLILEGAQRQRTFATEAAAKANRTRQCKAKNLNADDYLIADTDTFYATIEKKEIRHGIVGAEGKEFEVGVNERWTTGPWSETYWCS